MTKLNVFSLIPLSIAALFAFLLSFVYLLAVCYGHVKPIFPYISDAGATEPEAAYFSIILYLVSILIGINGWIRFKQIKYVFNNENFNNNKAIDEKHMKKIHLFNDLGLYASIAAMLGIGVVAAFRATEHLEIHLYIGVPPTFLGSFVIFCVQTWLSYQMIPTVNTLRTARFRLICLILAFTFGLISMTMVLFSWYGLNVPYSQIRGPYRLLWDEKTGGYVAHCISAVCEHLTIFMMCPFFGSFVLEFNRIETIKGRLKYKFYEIIQNV